MPAARGQSDGPSERPMAPATSQWTLSPWRDVSDPTGQLRRMTRLVHLLADHRRKPRSVGKPRMSRAPAPPAPERAGAPPAGRVSPCSGSRTQDPWTHAKVAE